MFAGQSSDETNILHYNGCSFTAGAAMLHSGCLFYGLRSACIDVPGLTLYDDKIVHFVHPQFPATHELSSRWNTTSEWTLHHPWGSSPSFNLSGAQSRSWTTKKRMNEHVVLLCLNKRFVHWKCGIFGPTKNHSSGTWGM